MGMEWEFLFVQNWQSHEFDYGKGGQWIRRSGKLDEFFNMGDWAWDLENLPSTINDVHKRRAHISFTCR